MRAHPGALPARILVYGVCGSGKTTLARRLGEASGLPWQPVDELTWEPGWIEVPVAEQRRRIEAVCRQDRWILDTAYGHWLEVPLDRAQLVIGPTTPAWCRSLG